MLRLEPFCANLEVCLGSLSCWKMACSNGISNFSKLSFTATFRMSQYCSASILPCTSVMIPTPFHPIHPQTIVEPPPCLTVPVVVLSESGSPCVFQTQQ